MSEACICATCSMALSKLRIGSDRTEMTSCSGSMLQASMRPSNLHQVVFSPNRLINSVEGGNVYCRALISLPLSLVVTIAYLG